MNGSERLDGGSANSRQHTARSGDVSLFIIFGKPSFISWAFPISPRTHHLLHMLSLRSSSQVASPSNVKMTILCCQHRYSIFHCIVDHKHTIISWLSSSVALFNVYERSCSNCATFENSSLSNCVDSYSDLQIGQVSRRVMKAPYLLNKMRSALRS